MLNAAHPVHLVLGLVVWSVWFVAMYGGLSVACAIVPPPETAGALTWINGLLLLLTGFTAAALLYGAGRCWLAVRAAADDPQLVRFIPGVSALVYLSASGAVLAIGLPVIVLPPCL
jgi:hypothetical protein